MAEIQLRDKISKEHNAQLEIARTRSESDAKDLNAQYIGQVPHHSFAPFFFVSPYLRVATTNTNASRQVLHDRRTPLMNKKKS